MITEMPNSMQELADDISAVYSDAPAQKATTSTLYIETCPKCMGGGKYYGRSQFGTECFMCHGKGKLTFKTSPEVRGKNRASAAKSKEKKAENNLAAFEATYKSIAEWWAGKDEGFAASLKESVRKYGSLTPGQMSAALRSMEKSKADKAEALERKESAQEVNIEVIEQSFSTAKKSGLKKPKLRLGGFVFTPAPETGKNAGAIYVKRDDEYLGKVQGGKFYRTRECSPEVEAEVVAVASNPKDAAIAYGRLTGCCSVCGRPLDNKESVARGIGPICAERFAW